ncbi:hypothetical protein BKA70DRAFT_1371651 [Coprinopsis sp. MPI-PUGE-AT-0042]|nr:hypothetical protein BKA70DRAFT_1371651 [Coprinopsis sp. MPI-PUGE-AT-0042]
MAISPADDDLKSALIELKSRNPAMGITKIHALLLKERPEWTVSEKRTKKILQSEGLVSGPSGSATAPQTVFPSSKVIPDLDFYDKCKGKGLEATAELQEGEVIWKEDPFVISPEWDIYDLVAQGKACALCTTPFSDTPLVTTCPASSTSSFCPARFCNRLCLKRSANIHPLLCPSQNPASVPLLKFARASEWMALGALGNCIARILLARQQDDAVFQADWNVMRSFASLGMEDRAKHSYNMRQPDREAWKKAHQLVVQAFKDPKGSIEQKKLAKILKKPLPQEVDDDLFAYESGFLQNLGKMSLNLEAHGGLYTLHSHLNHSCTPNVSVRHIDKRAALSRITLIAKRAISANEELTVTYVNPELPYKARQEELKAWGFGSCRCDRCLSEEKLQGPLEKENDGGDMDDLARELKAGLGVM